MSLEVRVETFHTEAIKPSSPTPLEMKIFKPSLLDQMTPVIYIPLIFWYPVDHGAAIANHDHFPVAEERSRRLKESLSQTLTRFYPFAGRISHSLIDCNDEGVDYIEARVNCRLHDILKQPDIEMLREFLPIEKESSEAATERALLVKVNFFECGDMAIGVSISHKVSDPYTLGKFINSWAATTRDSNEAVFPEFGCAASFLPPPPDLLFKMPAMEFKHQKAALRRLVFEGSKISRLKARSASASVPQPTRVEAVAALIWKSAMAASSSNRGFAKPSVLREPVNLRKRLNPPLPENSVGYLVSYFLVQTQGNETELQELVKHLRDGIREFSETYVKKLQGNEAISTIVEAAKEVGNLSKRSDEIEFYNCISWCRFNLYEADFGWGKPKWVSVAGAATPKVFLLMDTRDGEGIEAWVGLPEEEMAVFVCNEELLAFASMDPSVSS